jgi:hypothetical protein
MSYEEELEEQRRIQDNIEMKYRIVDVYMGNEEFAMTGTTRITRNIFAGTQDKTENALLFLDNLSRINKSKKDGILTKQGLLRKHGGRDNDMMSQASYPTVDGHEMASSHDGQ